MVVVDKLIFFGTGAIGTSVGAWVAERYDETYFFSRGKAKEALIDNGITYYFQDGVSEGIEGKYTTIQPVKHLDSLKELSETDVLFLGVKNYNLAEVAELINRECESKPIIVSMSNGRYNQVILPKYFSRIIYSVVCYNAWRDIEVLEEKNRLVVGAQKRGPLVMGTLDNSLQEEMVEIKKIMDNSVEMVITENIQDAVYCKIAINLTNALTALIGYGIQPLADQDAFQQLMTRIIWEGVEIIKAEGIRECKLGGMPSWSTIKQGAKLPKILTRRSFRKAMEKTRISSMTQDIVQRKLGVSELDSLNGYILELANKHGIDAPYNRTVYNLCNDRFNKNFRAMDAKDVLKEVQSFKG